MGESLEAAARRPCSLPDPDRACPCALRQERVVPDEAGVGGKAGGTLALRRGGGERQPPRVDAAAPRAAQPGGCARDEGAAAAKVEPNETAATHDACGKPQPAAEHEPVR